MQIAVGFLLAVCIGLLVALGFVIYVGRVFVREMNVKIGKIFDLVTALPAPVQNVIHLDRSKVRVGPGVVPISLSIKPEDFRIQADKLYNRLVDGFKRRLDNFDSAGLETHAFCILDHAGFMAYVDGPSCRAVQDCLTILLMSGDGNAIKRFLRTVADSVGFDDGEVPLE